MLVTTYIEKLKKEAEDEMIAAMRPKSTSSSLATGGSSGYNKTNKYGSYTGSTTGLSTEKSPLNTTTSFTAPKKTTTTQRAENYFQKARETQRELAKPLPRINTESKKDESNFSLSAGNTLKPDTKTTNFSLSDDAAKRYNLPTTTERDFGKGLFGEKEEQNLYNKMVYEIFGPKKTKRQLFLEGFEGKEQEIPDDVSYLVPKQDIQSERGNNLKLPLETIPRSRMEAFAKIRDENASQNAKPQFHAAYKPEDKKAELDPDVTMLRNFDAKNTVKPIGEYDPSKEPVITQYSIFRKNSSGIKPFTKDFNNNIFTSWRKRYIEKCNGIDGVFNTDYYYAEKDGKRYRANSEETVRLYDWTSIDETFLDETFEKLINEANQKPTGMYRILSQSIGGDLDFKLKLDENKLYLANGVLYNKNEAGNFMWAYFLESKKVSGYLSGALAQAGSKLPPLAKMDGGSRWDEEWDVKARWAGVKYYYEKNNLMWLYEELYGESPKI